MRNAVPFLLVLLGLAGVPGCAKKMLPPSPDRFAPRLQAVRTRNRVRLELEFNENIDARSVDKDSILVRDGNGVRLEVRGAVSGRRGAWVEIWTMPQQEELYEVEGMVVDLAGNPGRFKARFRGSDRRDTLPPTLARVMPGPGTEGHVREIVRVQFSEPMDTSRVPRYLFLPEGLDTSYTRTWEPDWKELGLLPGRGEQALEVDSAEADSTPGRAVYFLVVPGGADLEGNPLRSYGHTWFTTDTLLETTTARGRVSWPDSVPLPGAAFFRHDEHPGMTSILTDGSFSTRLVPGEYRFVAVCDTNLDGVADLRAGPQPFATAQESLSVTLEPESLPRPIHEYRR